MLGQEGARQRPGRLQWPGQPGHLAPFLSGGAAVIAPEGTAAITAPTDGDRGPNCRDRSTLRTPARAGVPTAHQHHPERAPLCLPQHPWEAGNWIPGVIAGDPRAREGLGVLIALQSTPSPPPWTPPHLRPAALRWESDAGTVTPGG